MTDRSDTAAASDPTPEGPTRNASHSGTPSKVARTTEVLRVLARHVRIDWLKLAQLDLPESIEPSAPETLADDLEELGATFVKLGQLLSSRTDFVPEPYIEALSRLHERVKPLDSATVRAILEEELGAPAEVRFAHFELEPLASASLGQVHRAILRRPSADERDAGAATGEEFDRQVVVKVQRPGIRESIHQDFEILEQIARALDRNTDIARRVALPEIVDEMRSAMNRELDYRIEARSLDRLGEILEDYPLIEVPRPLFSHSTGRVLTMTWVDGVKVTEIDPGRQASVDGSALADELFGAYLEQVLVHGFFHADPHPGNLLVTTDGRLALIDLGMTGELTRERRSQLIKLLTAIADGRAGEAAEVCVEIGEREPHFDRRRFDRGVETLVGQADHASLDELRFGELMVSMVRLAAETGLRTAPELSILAKTLLQLDQAALALDPRFEPIPALRRHAQRIVGRHLLSGFSPGSIVGAGLEVRELIQTLPRRANAVLGALAENRLAIGVDAIDETRLYATLQRATNRLAVSIVLAALILGAALLIQIDTTWKLFGYPAIALFLFLLAATCGFYLVFDVFRGEVRAGRRRR